MSDSLGAAFNYTDLGGLATLRREAAADTPEARRAVAQQFEAMFLNMMLKQMRDASVVEGGLVDRSRMRSHEDMLDHQLALSLSRGPGIGLADAIARQLGGAEAVIRPGAADLAGPRFAGPAPGAGRLDRVVAGAPWKAPASPAEFVRSLMPHARRASRELGVAPEVLVAQAALETGWGRHMISDPQGRPSFNLFGIKAGAGWGGPRMTVTTVEYEDGIAQRRREPFRAYAGPAESFADYVRLVGQSPRYREALAAGDAEGYLRGLQAGGYATDPEYANKILAILERGLPGLAQERRVPADTTASVTGPGRRVRDGGES